MINNEVGSIATETIGTANAPVAQARAACPACGGQGHDLFKLHHGMTLLACRACGTVHLHPRPTAAETSALYSDAYGNASESYFSKVDKKLRRSRRRMGVLARLTPDGQPKGRFLDIGCNGGFIVEAARERGFDAYGLDIDPVSIDYARRHYPANRFVLSTLEDYAPHAPRFDLIYCSEVIEHLADPRGFIDTLFDLLAPGGLFFLTTPDISHWRRARDVTRWDGFCPPSHCVYFNPRSLTALLRRAGFVGVERRWSFKPGIKLTCRKPASI